MTLKTIGLLGNPNCGKSTLFNRLTGANQRVGNWPGVTVERKTGSLTIAGERFEIIDLPGIYSLDQSAGGIDEAVARDYIASGECDLVINIVDASNLQRHLILTQQLLDSGLPVVIALNMLDVAERAGLSLDPIALSKALQVPVVPMVASRNVGIKDLLEILQSTQSKDQTVIKSSRLSATSASSSETLAAAERRYHKAVAIGETVTQVKSVRHPPSETIDRIVLNRWLGIPIFLAAMYLMFTVAINLGAVFIDFFDILFGAIFVTASEQLRSDLGLPVWLIVLLSQGLGGGIQLVATFIPVIGFLFLCLSVMEDSG